MQASHLHIISGEDPSPGHPCSLALVHPEPVRSSESLRLEEASLSTPCLCPPASALAETLSCVCERVLSPCHEPLPARCHCLTSHHHPYHSPLEHVLSLRAFTTAAICYHQPRPCNAPPSLTPPGAPEKASQHLHSRRCGFPQQPPAIFAAAVRPCR